MITLPKVAAVFADITVTAKLANGSAATVTGIDVAIVAPGAKPTTTTAWVAANWAAPLAQVLLVGSLATPVGAPPYRLNVPDVGGDLWARIVDNPEQVAALVAHIELE